MYDAKPIVAKNISELRQKAGMTQMELAERLNYSDKAVSKWERGESVPDVSVLYEISRLFGVTVDRLVTEQDESGENDPAVSGQKSANAPDERKEKKNRAFITAMSVILVWLVATMVYVILDIVLGDGVRAHLLAFVYAVPVSFIVWLVLNTVWFSRRRNFLIISLLMWSLLASFVVTMALFGVSVWQILVLGVPGQIIILLWSRIRFAK